jgi:hypothetical protein
MAQQLITLYKSVPSSSRIDVTNTPEYATVSKLVSDLRDHIVRSPSTLNAFFGIISLFWEGSTRTIACPTETEVKEYFRDSFPIIISTCVSKGAWGVVSKKQGDNENAISIRHTLIDAVYDSVCFPTLLFINILRNLFRQSILQNIKFRILFFSF